MAWCIKLLANDSNHFPPFICASANESMARGGWMAYNAWAPLVFCLVYGSIPKAIVRVFFAVSIQKPTHTKRTLSLMLYGTMYVHARARATAKIRGWERATCVESDTLDVCCFFFIILWFITFLHQHRQLYNWNESCAMRIRQTLTKPETICRKMRNCRDPHSPCQRVSQSASHSEVCLIYWLFVFGRFVCGTHI